MSTIEKMVNRFLGWKLPKDFSPDAGISFKPTKPYEEPEWPVGTNLLTADQAKHMFEYVMEEEKEPWLLPHQQRVLQEKKELDEKLERLRAFLASPAALNVPDDERTRLQSQLHIMREYSGILLDRINVFCGGSGADLD